MISNIKGNADGYWDIFADTATEEAKKLRLQVMKASGENFRPTNKEQTDKALELLQKSAYVINGREDKPTRSKPAAPFTTSTLQQAASTRLTFSVKKTMMMAQRLYEAGYITYMRTDSTNLSQEAVESCRAYIESTFDNLSADFTTLYLQKNP